MNDENTERKLRFCLTETDEVVIKAVNMLKSDIKSDPLINYTDRTALRFLLKKAGYFDQVEA